MDRALSDLFCQKYCPADIGQSSNALLHLSTQYAKGELHGFSHTYVGATLIGLFCALSGKYLGELGLRILGEPRHLPISWPVSFASAYIGTYTHVAIDSIMHADIQPLAPFTEDSVLHGIISIEALHLVCVSSAVIGGLVYYVVERTYKKT